MSCPSPGRLSAYVDGALAHRDRERLAVHLVACAMCRRRVSDLRGVRDRVRNCARPSAAPPEDLATRLVGIAGDEARDPLYARPFSARPRPRAMPGRRRLRRTALVAGTGVSTLTLILVAVGWLAAPPVRVPALDPTAVARNEFLAALGTEPLTNPAVTAAVAHTPAGATELAVGPPITPTVPSEGAYARLQQADRVARTTAYAGTQTVQVRHLNGFWRSRVDVEARAGSGVHVVVNPGAAGSAPRLVPHETTVGVDLVAASHTLTTGEGPLVAGRRTQLVEATDDQGLAARWWLDDETGLMLWSQAFEEGRMLRSSGFDSIRFGGSPGGQVAPRLTMQLPVTSLALASVSQRAQDGFTCPSTAGGLELVRVRESGGMLHTMYGNGVDTLSVFEAHGALGGAPSGTVWDPELRVYRGRGLPTMLTWQSRDRVFTVVTNAHPQVAVAAMRALPHEAPVLRTRTDRVIDGWRTILAAMGVRS